MLARLRLLIASHPRMVGILKSGWPKAVAAVAAIVMLLSIGPVPERMAKARAYLDLARAWKAAYDRDAKQAAEFRQRIAELDAQVKQADEARKRAEARLRATRQAWSRPASASELSDRFAQYGLTVRDCDGVPVAEGGR